MTPTTATIPAQVASRIEQMRRIPESALGHLRELRAALVDIVNRPRIAPDSSPEAVNMAQTAMTEETAAARERAIAAIEELRTTGESQRSSAEAAARQVIDGPAPTDPSERLALEMERSAAWERAKAVLDALPPARTVGRIEQLATDSVRDADAAMLAALRRESPLYFEARGVPEMADEAMRRVTNAQRPTARRPRAPLPPWPTCAVDGRASTWRSARPPRSLAGTIRAIAFCPGGPRRLRRPAHQLPAQRFLPQPWPAGEPRPDRMSVSAAGPVNEQPAPLRVGATGRPEGATLRP